MTQQHLQFLQPVPATKEKPLSYKIVRSVPHSKLTGLSLSTFADGYVVCHVAEAADDASKEDKKLSAEGDAVFESGRKAEIVQVLKEKVPRKGGELSLSFSDTLSFTAKNNSLLGGKPKQKTIDFSEDGAAAGRGATIEVPTKKNKMPPSKLIVKIPPALGGMASLRMLDLDYSLLSGTLPTTLGRLQRLANLDVGTANHETARNRLSGVLPTELGRCAGLLDLNVKNMRLSGTVPTELGGLAKLQTFKLAIADLLMVPPDARQKLRSWWGNLSGTLPDGLRENALAACTMGQLPRTIAKAIEDVT